MSIPRTKRSLTGRIYNAYKEFSRPLSRLALPVNSREPVLPGSSISVTAGPQSTGFKPESLIISAAGTPGGSADWLVNDILISNKSIFLQAGDIPGDVFAHDATKGFIDWSAPILPGVQVQLLVTYIGSNEKGIRFNGCITGIEYDPGLLDVLREAIVAWLTTAARGFFYAKRLTLRDGGRVRDFHSITVLS